MIPEALVSEQVELSGETIANALRLLSHLWSRPVSEEIERRHQVLDLELDVRRELEGASEDIVLLCSRGRDGTTSLLDEYERLFVGPGPVPCPPYESYWREDVQIDLRRSLMGPCTAQLGDLYLRTGLQFSQDTGELPDHVAGELEAASYAMEHDQTDVARAIVVEHLGACISRLCRAVSHSTEEPYYRELARITPDWLDRIGHTLEAAEHSPG